VPASRDAQYVPRAVSIQPVGLRNGITIRDPLAVALQFLEVWRDEPGDLSSSFAEPDLRRANRAGARISAAEISAILERRRAIERALRDLPPHTSLAEPASEKRWRPLRQLFEAFAGIRGVGFSKMTKALHPKRPALIPMLDSVVQSYLAADDPGAGASFADRAVALVHAYKRDLDHNAAAIESLRHELAGRGHAVTDVRILDMLIWSPRG
jgi:hypothetical protein